MADDQELPQDTASTSLPAMAPEPEPEAEESPMPSPVHDVDLDDDVKKTHKQLLQWIDSVNIAEDLDDDVLGAIGQRVVREYTIDDDSRSDWKMKSEKAMALAMQVAEIKQYPWPKASNVIYPLMTVSAIQFAARAYPAIISGKEVVKGVVVGEDDGVPAVDPNTGQPPLINPQTGQPMWIVQPGEKQSRAARIGQHMSYQLLDEQPEWEEETDRLLHILPIAGCAFRKSYFDSAHDRNASVLVSAMKVVINYHAKSMETAPRVTEEVDLYPLEITEKELAGVFIPITYTPAPGASGDEDAPQQFLEQHRWWDLDDDGYPEPYIVTVHKDSARVVRIVARYDHDSVKINPKGEVIKIEPVPYYTKYDFLPNPEGGIYGVGFGQLLRPVNEAINTTLNMMIDAGHLQVVGGGFIGKGLSMHTGNVRFTPGEYKGVNVPGATVKENIVPLNTPGPSAVLFQLLGMLIEGGKEIASVKDVLTGEQKNANVPATTTLALIEQGLKVFTAIYKRFYRSLKKELAILYRLNRVYMPEQGAGYRVNNQWKSITKQDYMKGSGVEPVADPSMVSDMQKLGRTQFLLGFANDPYFNGMEIRRRALVAASIEKPDELLVKQLPPNPEVLEKASRLEISHERTKAEAAKDYANAILYLSQAAKVAGDAHLAWIEQQLEIYKARMESLNGSEAGQPPAAPAGGDNGAGLPDMAAAPSEPNHLPVPQGLPSGPQGNGMGLPTGQPG